MTEAPRFFQLFHRRLDLVIDNRLAAGQAQIIARGQLEALANQRDAGAVQALADGREIIAVEIGGNNAALARIHGV